MLITKCTVPPPQGYNPARAPCCQPPPCSSGASDPPRPGCPMFHWPAHPGLDSTVSFSSTEGSSHQQALHVRPFLSWITDLSPLLPSSENVPALLWKCMNDISLCPCPLCNFSIVPTLLAACNFVIDFLKCKSKEVSRIFLPLNATAS